MDVVEARILVESMVEDIPALQPLALDGNSPIETPDWWIFFYDTAAFLTSGRDEDRLIGATALVVDRRTGDVHHAPSWQSLDDYLASLAPGGSAA